MRIENYHVCQSDLGDPITVFFYVDGPSKESANMALELYQQLNTAIENLIGTVPNVEDVPKKDKKSTKVREKKMVETLEQPLENSVVETEELPIIDLELQQYCARLASQCGGSGPIYDLSREFVDPGSDPKPTNIIGNEKRKAFIDAAEKMWGVKFYGTSA